MTNYSAATILLNNVDRNVGGDSSFKILVWGVAENATNGAISSDDIEQIGYAPRIRSVVDRLLSKKGMDVSIVADEVTSGTAATGQIAVSGTAKASYEISVYYNGERYKVGIVKGDTSTDIATKIESSINEGVLLTAVTAGSDIDLESNETNKYANKSIYIRGISSDVTFTITDMVGGTGEVSTTNLGQALSTNVWYKMVVNTEEFVNDVAQEIKNFGASRYDKFVHKPFVCFHATNKDVESVGVDADDRSNACCVVMNSVSGCHDIVAEISLKQAELEMDYNAMSLTKQVLSNIDCPPISITKVTNMQAAGFTVCENEENSCKVNLGRTRGTETGFIFLASIYKNIKMIGFFDASLVQGGYLGKPVVDNASLSTNINAIDTKIIFDVVRGIFNTTAEDAIIDSASQAIEDSEVVRDTNDANRMIVRANYKISGNLYNLDIFQNFKEN